MFFIISRINSRETTIAMEYTDEEHRTHKLQKSTSLYIFSQFSRLVRDILTLYIYIIYFIDIRNYTNYV